MDEKTWHVRKVHKSPMSRLISIEVSEACCNLLTLDYVYCGFLLLASAHPFTSTMHPRPNQVCLTFSDPTKKVCITIPTFEDVGEFFATFHREISEYRRSNHSALL